MMAAMQPPPLCAVVFDIDGVLALGKSAIPGAASAVRQLAAHRIPWICLTNGGGDTEAGKAERLAAMLGVPVHPEQIVMSFSPLRPMCAQFADRMVLVVGQQGGRPGGKSGITAVCRSLGLRKAVTTRQLVSDDPHRFAALEPPVHPDDMSPLSNPDEAFAAVMILDDPTNWGLDIQLVCDVLRSGLPLGTGCTEIGRGETKVHQSVPIYSAQCDFTYAGRHAAPRFTMGAFQIALNAVWKAYCARLEAATADDASCDRAPGDLSIVQYGKPSKATFDYALQQARRWAVLAEQIGAHERITGVEEETGSSTGGAAAEPSAHGSMMQWTVEEVEQHRAAWSAVCDLPDASLPALTDGVYMIGDNPQSDIAGANQAGHPWVSVLVRTGVFQGSGLNDAIHPAHTVCKDVCEAVAWIVSGGIHGK